jgi:SecD/SecF fusion protein
MSPIQTFLFGLALLGLFAWYFITELSLRKRLLGSALTILITAFCIDSVLPLSEKINLGLDLKGGSQFLIRLQAEEGQMITPDAQERAVEVIRARVDAYGVGEPVIAPAGGDRILVQIPALEADKIQEARAQLERVAKLEFRLVHPESARLAPLVQEGLEVLPPGYVLATLKDREGNRTAEMPILMRKTADVGGERVTSAGAFYDTRGYGVVLNFDSEGAKQFAELTRAHVGEQFAIVLDGVVQSAPVIREEIPNGQATITGRFTDEEARNLASVLENPLSTPVVIEEERSVSGTLGADAIASGIYGGLLGVALTVVLVLIYYHFAGIVAVIALALNVVLLFGIMALFNFTLTLPGIAGIILTVGMAVDANVLIYERLREEMAAGKSLRASIEGAYEKAFSAIFDSNVTTLITAAILFWQATGAVRGFAVTLTVGIVASMFTALLVTRNVFSWALELGIIKRLSMFNLFGKTSFDFLGKGRLAVGASIVAILILVGVFVVRGERNFGVDFKGGDLLKITANENVTEADIRAAIEPLGFSEASIQREKAIEGGKETISIRGPFESGQQIAAHLEKTMPDAGIEIGSLDRVGPVVGRELAKGSLIALALSVVGILIYVAARFEVSFAVGAIIALVHDVVITLGILAALGQEFSLITVGAILTIAGYSINDTIVVFDRVREGLHAHRKGSIVSIMNASINETLSRTVLTGGTTLVSVAALYFYGGAVLRDFALTILIGVLVGTYSSVFVASPVVLWWSRRGGANLRKEVRQADSQTATP